MGANQGDVAQMLDKCKTDVELELTLCRCLNYDHLVADLETGQGLGFGVWGLGFRV